MSKKQKQILELCEQIDFHSAAMAMHSCTKKSGITINFTKPEFSKKHASLLLELHELTSEE